MDSTSAEMPQIQRVLFPRGFVLFLQILRHEYFPLSLFLPLDSSTGNRTNLHAYYQVQMLITEVQNE